MLTDDPTPFVQPGSITRPEEITEELCRVLASTEVPFTGDTDITDGRPQELQRTLVKVLLSRKKPDVAAVINCLVDAKYQIRDVQRARLLRKPALMGRVRGLRRKLERALQAALTYHGQLGDVVHNAVRENDRLTQIVGSEAERQPLGESWRAYVAALTVLRQDTVLNPPYARPRPRGNPYAPVLAAWEAKLARLGLSDPVIKDLLRDAGVFIMTKADRRARRP